MNEQAEIDGLKCWWVFGTLYADRMRYRVWAKTASAAAAKVEAFTDTKVDRVEPAPSMLASHAGGGD